jgi:hypothetical protein
MLKDLAKDSASASGRPLNDFLAFFTVEALTGIAQMTIENITSFEATGRAAYEVTKPD